MKKKKYPVVVTNKNIFLKNKNWAIVLVAQFLFFYILSKLDFAVNFFSKLFEWKKSLHIAIFSKFNFSFGDLVYILITIIWIYLVWGLIKNRNSKFLKYILISFNIFYFMYQCFWGMLYFQTPIINKLQKRKISDYEVKNLTLKYLELCKKTREKVAENKNGVFIIRDIRQLKLEILKQQKNLPQNISIKKPVTYLSVKPSVFDSFMNKTGILGYYNPFTAESQYNPNIPATQLPFTLAHEMSHQLGYAREQEASFIAYLYSKKTNNADLQYSAQLYILKSLLRSIAKNDKPFAESIIGKYSVKMKKDRENEVVFAEKNKGIISDFFGATNDLFLKTNQQDGQVSYSYFINLLLLYEL